MPRQFTAIIYPDDGLYTALCPELDIASGGDTVEAARANLTEALELFLEDASPEELETRYAGRVHIIKIEPAVA